MNGRCNSIGPSLHRCGLPIGHFGDHTRNLDVSRCERWPQAEVKNEQPEIKLMPFCGHCGTFRGFSIAYKTEKLGIEVMCNACNRVISLCELKFKEL